jgi:hypothetical protein
VYFDRGVIEVVTPVIELAPRCTARAVRNLWEQIGFVRDQLTRWGNETDHTVRLKAYSTHYNISYEMPEHEQTPERNIQTLALLLTYILPVPVMLLAANRRSTGIGVRPREKRIEVTCDFTPEPSLMVATTTLIVGIVREVMKWPTYDLSILRKLPIPVIDGVIPGKHTTRKGWLTKDFHYEQSPYTADIDARLWTTQFGEKRSLRQIGKEAAWYFRRSIRRFSDPFSFRLLFAVLDGRAPSLLELADRPRAYDDVGRLCRWGMVIDELKAFRSSHAAAIDDYTIERLKAREAHLLEMATVNAATPLEKTLTVDPKALAAPPPTPSPRPSARMTRVSLRYLDRRGTSLIPVREVSERRRATERRRRANAIPFPDRRLTRSAYEQVFLKLVSGSRLRMNGDVYRPVGMKGWYEAILRRESDGSEMLMTIDQLLTRMGDWV